MSLVVLLGRCLINPFCHCFIVNSVTQMDICLSLYRFRCRFTYAGAIVTNYNIASFAIHVFPLVLFAATAALSDALLILLPPTLLLLSPFCSYNFPKTFKVCSLWLAPALLLTQFMYSSCLIYSYV